MRKWFALVLFVALSARAQSFDLTIDNIMRGPGLVGYPPEDVRWTPDATKVFFSWKQHSDPTHKDRDTYVVNRDGSGLRKLSDEEKKDAPPPTGDRTRDKRMVVYADDGDIVLWDGRQLHGQTAADHLLGADALPPGERSLVQRAVLQSPRLTDQEVEAFASMASLTDEILRLIANNRTFRKNYTVVRNLMNNSKTPLDVTLHMLPTLNAIDLKRLTTNKNVPETLRTTAQKLHRTRSMARP